MTLKLHNQLTKTVDPFTPQLPGKVSIYTCGPTVYNYPHVGNWSGYIYWDTLIRLLGAHNLEVTRVMNITDVGHLVSDGDEGEDKLEKGARREGKTAWEVAAFYTEDFLAGITALNLITPNHITKATEYIPQQLELVRALKQRGYTYQISDGIYFDTSKFPTYGDFANLDLAALKAGARVEYNPEKRGPSDFALWKFTPEGETRDMEWETPRDLLDANGAKSTDDAASAQENHKATAALENTSLTRDFQGAEGDSRSNSSDGELAQESHNGENGDKVMGFPGWHLECSAMAMSILGNTLDIHTGGIDHIPVHHTNEIAQSEAATGDLFSRFWLHNNHLKSNGTKISKSLDNGFTLQDIAAKGYDPLDFRLFVLQSHYRSEGNFTFENLESAKHRRRNWRNIAALRHQIHSTLERSTTQDDNHGIYASAQALVEKLNNDIDTPAALALIDELFSTIAVSSPETIHRSSFVDLLETIDQLLGLDLVNSTPDITDEQKQLILARNHARDEKDWKAADALRDTLLDAGIALRDTETQTIWEYAEQ